MNNKKSIKGISVLGLIVLIVGIIILGAVLRFIIRMLSGDQFNKFKTDFDAYVSTIEKDALNRKTKATIQLTDAQVYYSIANGIPVGDEVKIEPTGNINNLGLDLKAGTISGIDFYEIKSDSNIMDVNGQKTFYDADEKHYITDMGDVFILPGFNKNEEGVNRWYINANNYYEYDKPITNINEIKVNDLKITTDPEGQELAGENLKKDTKLYISFSANLDNEKAEITPSVPFEITKNGNYSFYLSVAGRRVSKSVEVTNYRSQDIFEMFKVGDYISYVPDDNNYSLSKSVTGNSNNMQKTEEKAWRVLYVDKESRTMLITTNGVTNKGISLGGPSGFVNGEKILNSLAEELYSNRKLKLKARSLNLDDADKIFGQKAPENQPKVAYYPRGTEVSGTIEYEGNEYKKVASPWRISRFYISDGGGTESTDENGLKYNSPEVDNPVFVTQSFYDYEVDLENSLVKDVLGNSDSWLASNAIYLGNSGAGFGIRIINQKGITADVLYDAYANAYNSSYGFHPVIELNDDYGVDISDSSLNGSSPEKAWKILKFE